MTGPETSAKDWSPEAYGRFRGLRLRPALDLLMQVLRLPEGPVVDLGCGAGAAAEALTSRFPGHLLHGVDRSSSMLQEAEATGHYGCLEQSDIGDWSTERPPALIFANAVINWLPRHEELLPRLATLLCPGGVLAVQAPKQQTALSHALLRSLSADLFPDRFDWTDWREEVHDLDVYDRLLSPLGETTLWETTYVQSLPPTQEGHPIRYFTLATAGRRVTQHLTSEEEARFISAYDAALEDAYPRRDDGSVFFPFRRIFFVLRRPEG